MALLTGYECCLSCCMLGKHHHSQCNKIPVECYIASMPNATKSPVAHCCPRHSTDDHLVKLTLFYIQFYIQQDPCVDLVASGKLHTVIHVVLFVCLFVYSIFILDISFNTKYWSPKRSRLKHYCILHYMYLRCTKVIYTRYIYSTCT